MRTILVTGGCGFIGSHLSEALAARGDRLRVLDDLSTGRADALPIGARLLRGDVADPSLLRKAMKGVDACIHLAAVASVEKGVRDWLGTHRTNLSGTIAVFDAARREGLARGHAIPVVYASSAAVYGDCVDQPIEEAAAVRPLSAYGADKLGCELHARVAGAVYGVPTLGLRFFNVFGPRQDPASPYSGVISIFCNRIRRGQPISIFGDGGQTRDFIYVGDVVSALLIALDAATPAAPTYNVCSGIACSVGELADRIGRLCGVPPIVSRQAPRQGEIRHSLGSPLLSRAALRLGKPLGLDDGLRHVLDWMRETDRQQPESNAASKHTQE